MSWAWSFAFPLVTSATPFAGHYLDLLSIRLLPSQSDPWEDDPGNTGDQEPGQNLTWHNRNFLMFFIHMSALTFIHIKLNLQFCGLVKQDSKSVVQFFRAGL